MKIQPIDWNVQVPVSEEVAGQEKLEPLKPVVRSRLFKRLFESPFSSVLRISASEKLLRNNERGEEEFEPSSTCLARMVGNFIEDNNEEAKCNKNRCNCFTGNFKDGQDEAMENSYDVSSSRDLCDTLKNLVFSASVFERNLLGEVARIVERNKMSRRKDGICKKIVADGLKALGYNASICISKWEKTPLFLAGEYEYVDVLVESEERFVVDIDFVSEFEIARCTKAYKLVLETLPSIFVGKPDRLEKIICMASEAAEQSLKKRGMPFPPWRKAEYVKSKWLSPYTRHSDRETATEKSKWSTPISKPWEPPEVEPRKRMARSGKAMTGLASIII